MASYFAKFAKISKNCRLLIYFFFFASTSSSIIFLLLNLYLLEVGFSKENIALFNSINFLGSGLMAIPLAFILENVPRKLPFIGSALVINLAFLGICFSQNFTLLAVLAFLAGSASSILNVLVLPFLTENSLPEERVHLFSLFSAQGWASSMLGSLVGGFLPTFVSQVLHPLNSSWNYRGSILLALFISLLSLLFLLFIREKPKKKGASINLEPAFPSGNPPKGAMPKFLLIELIIFLGAGLFMPFMNLYFSTVLKVGSGEIGLVFTIASGVALAGTMLSPILAEKMGKVKATFLCQALSIPLLVGLGLVFNFYAASVLYIFRLALMNMSNPLLDSLGMEIVPPQRRATFAGMMRTTQPLSWAAMGPLAGMVMERYGFSPLFFIASGLYLISSFTLLGFFGKMEQVKSFQ
ncbi:MAG: MFS transporter [Caldiserica bacterium]|nr:MFS transporter [Caldisericota bacterium]